ncbi:signal recognition particle subunit SRP72 [Clonorchis sinensis]|uniref:Signal recognition particle subunit SRP72 n=1 Tax=Clonorchis sinensis TaxID=79923 RepID=G7YRQ0_CLOSI|nr:signal recognition particle subunit SRP72 [Clonorchis sinensis]
MPCEDEIKRISSGKNCVSPFARITDLNGSTLSSSVWVRLPDLDEGFSEANRPIRALTSHSPPNWTLVFIAWSATGSMASSKSFDLAAAFADLSRSCSVQAYQKVLTTATKNLHMAMKAARFDCCSFISLSFRNTPLLVTTYLSLRRFLSEEPAVIIHLPMLIFRRLMAVRRVLASGLRPGRSCIAYTATLRQVVEEHNAAVLRLGKMELIATIDAFFGQRSSWCVVRISRFDHCDGDNYDWCHSHIPFRRGSRSENPNMAVLGSFSVRLITSSVTKLNEKVHEHEHKRIEALDLKDRANYPDLDGQITQNSDGQHGSLAPANIAWRIIVPLKPDHPDTVTALNQTLFFNEQFLSKYPKEHLALQCKAVALIRTEKYEECLSTVKKFPELTKYVIFEKAYAEYRLNRIHDALKTLEDGEPNDLRILELKAQVLYRLEEFTEAYACLRQVIRNSQDDFGEERLTNLTAVAASAACFKQQHIDIDVNPDTYEGKFNLACYQLGLGNVAKAETLLHDAETVCRTALADDPEVTEDEVNEELAPITTQQAYLLQRAGKEDAANHIYQSVTRHRSTDPALLAVAANNIVCINKEQNIFDSRKRIKMASIDGLQHKLFAKQREEIVINQGLFYWHTNQADACHVKAKAVLQMNPHSARGVLLSVSQLLKERQYDRAASMLEVCSIFSSTGHDSTDDLSVLFSLAQLRLRRGTGGQICSGVPRAENIVAVDEFLVRSLPDTVLYAPGVVATRMALYLLACTGDGAVIDRPKAMGLIKDIVQKSLTWYETTNSKDPAYAQLLDKCANFLLQHGQAECAARLCEQQIARLDRAYDPRDEQQVSYRQTLVARLVRAYAQFDRPRAEAACKSLRFKEELSEAEVDSLETSFLYGAKAVRRQGRTGEQQPSEGKPPSKAKSTPVTPGLSSGDASVDIQAKRTRRKKKRPIRLPKNYQPGVMPDPERWLPRRERAHYRGKRRDKRYQPTRGPQGQISGGGEWDASARSPKVSSTTSPRPAEAPGSTPKQGNSAARQQQRKGLVVTRFTCGHRLTKTARTERKWMHERTHEIAFDTHMRLSGWIPLNLRPLIPSCQAFLVNYGHSSTQLISLIIGDCGRLKLFHGRPGQNRLPSGSLRCSSSSFIRHSFLRHYFFPVVSVKIFGLRGMVFNEAFPQVFGLHKHLAYNCIRPWACVPNDGTSYVEVSEEVEQPVGGITTNGRK